MDFSLEDLKFYAALRSKQRDWFSIASWLVGDSLQREETQEVCGKWNMFWQLWPELLTAEEGLGTTGETGEGWIKTGINWNDMDVCPASATTFFFPLFINNSVPCVCALFTPDQEFLAALLCLCSISHCWRGWKTKMHLDRGHLTWPQTRRNLAAAAPQFTIRINPVILQNHPSYTKAVYKVQLTWSVSTLPCVYITNSETDIVLTTWHNVTSHHQTQSRVRHHYLIILYPSLNTSFQS